jgi:hypothetical protein
VNAFQLEKEKGYPEGDWGKASNPNSRSAAPIGLSNLRWWKNRLADAEAECRRTANPKHRKEAEAKVARYRVKIEELAGNDQRPKAAVG